MTVIFLPAGQLSSWLPLSFDANFAHSHLMLQAIRNALDRSVIGTAPGAKYSTGF